jgi:hypothetical protein
MDFLMKQGFVTDTEAPGELKVGEFTDGGQNLVRTEPIDCRPGDPKDICPRKRAAEELEGSGGYTYKDYGEILGSPEVHADGEIWAQTLIDLRRRLIAANGEDEGTARAESLVTRAMELSVTNPSFVDMRNAILQADVAAGTRDHHLIWETFAARGMGNGAKSKDGSDAEPKANFDLPPGLPLDDRNVPRITIQSPPEGSVVRGEAVKLTGRVSDDVGPVTVTVAGAPATVGGGRWIVTAKLAEGAQTVSAEARDAAGHVGTATRKVTVDFRRPVIRVERILRASRGRIVVIGRVSDDAGIRAVLVEGRKARVRNGRFRLTVRRPRGRRVSVVAQDRAGRRSLRTVRIG